MTALGRFQMKQLILITARRGALISAPAFAALPVGATAPIFTAHGLSRAARRSSSRSPTR